MTDKVQLENAIIVLKARLFDASETRTRLENENKQLHQALSKIIDTLGIGNDGQVVVDDIIAAIEELYATNEVDEAEEE